MSDMLAFEQQLGAALNEYAGPRQPVDALNIARSARMRMEATPSIRRMLMPGSRPWNGSAIRATVRLVVIVVLVALAAALFVVGGGTRPEPTPTPRAVLDGAIAMERYAIEPGAWSQDGVAPPREIVLVADDGSVTVMSPAEREEACPTFSPDGSRLAFWSARRRGTPRTDPRYELAVAESVAGAPRTLLMPGLHAPPQFPSPLSWAPDGSALVAIVRSPDEPSPNEGDLVVVPVDGSAARTLVPSPRVPTGVTADRLSRLEGANWSPDGQWIAFRGERHDSDGFEYFVAVVRPDSTGLRLLDTWPGSSEWGGVVWAPDSRSVAYNRLDGDMDVYVAGLDDGSVRRLQAPGDQWATEWSPAGTHIATVGLSLDSIQILDAQTAEVTRTFGFSGGSASWSAGGDRIAFQDLDGRLWVAAMDAGREPRLAANGAPALCDGRGPAISWQELRP